MLNRNHHKRTLQKIIGERLAKARELCGMKQDQAAKKIGYINGSKLSKIELASDTMSVPLDKLVAASNLYQVSLDYLCGRVEDWDETVGTASDRNTALWLQDSFEKARSRDVWLIKRSLRRNELTIKSAALLLEEFSELKKSFEKFIDKNEDFEELKCGASLVYRFEKMAQAVDLVRGNLERMKFKHNADKGDQGDLFDGYEAEEVND